MSRITWGARTLIDQITSMGRDASYEPGEPDGLDVVRDITLTDSDTSDWLFNIFQVELDRRVQTALIGDDRHLTLTYRSGAIADEQEPYTLGEVDAILNGPAAADELSSLDPQRDGGPIEESKKAKRAPRKQA